MKMIAQYAAAAGIIEPNFSPKNWREWKGRDEGSGMGGEGCRTIPLQTNPCTEAVFLFINMITMQNGSVLVQVLVGTNSHGLTVISYLFYLFNS